MEKIKLQVPSNPLYLQTLRLTASSVANTMNFDIDQLEDIKVIVSEIYTYLIPFNEKINVKFKAQGSQLKIAFCKNNMGNVEGLSQVDFEMKKQILEALSDGFEMKDDKITVIIKK